MSRALAAKVRKLILGLIIGIVLMFIAGILYLVSPTKHDSAEILRAAITMGRLAPSLEDRKQLEAGEINGTFSGTLYLKFRASDQEISNLLEESDGLRGATPEPLEVTAAYLSRHEKEYERFPWFKPELHAVMKKYAIPQDDHANYGEVLVGGDVVYIKLSHS